MMAKIRKMRPEDIGDVEYICRMTAGPGCRKDPVAGNRIAKTYSTYYVRECCDTCFALADENDKAVGYVLCEPNYKRFRKIYRKVDVPAITALRKESGRKARFIPVPYTVFGAKYPAHLHVDILDEYQNKGYGSKLLETLFAELKKRNIKGVMLTTDSDNKGAVRFYERHGFKILVEIQGGIVMVKKLGD